MNPNVFVCVATTPDRAIRSYRADLYLTASEPMLFAETTHVNAADPSSELEGICRGLMAALSNCRLQPTRIVFDSQEQIMAFERYAESLPAAHRLNFLLKAISVTFAIPSKDEKKLWAEHKRKTQAALEDFVSKERAKAEHAAAIELEAFRRLAERERLAAEKEASIATKNAERQAQIEQRAQERRENEREQTRQREFNAAVSARMAKLVGGAR